MTKDATAPWHRGEQILQARLGIADRMAEVGSRIIRDFMPEQHREFYAQLPFVVLGGVDATDAPWATIVDGPPGFVTALDPHTLRIEARLGLGDPLRESTAVGRSLGMLGIELHTRRRNRMNGRVTACDARGFSIAVDQAFGNCPRFIQQRAWSATPDPAPSASGEATPQRHLDAAAREHIARADTFFVASAVRAEDATAPYAVDVSHRGGKPGFVRVDGDMLTIPDFAGNLFFNTLGNLLLNPRAGLLFVDFETGDLLQVTGTTEIVFDGDEVASFEGAERLWRLRVEGMVRRRGGLRLRWTVGAYSPDAVATGAWA